MMGCAGEKHAGALHYFYLIFKPYCISDRKEKTTPFGVNLMRSLAIHQAAQIKGGTISSALLVTLVTSRLLPLQQESVYHLDMSLPKILVVIQLMRT